MSSLEIRPAAAADLPFITEIYEHAVRHGTATFELIPPDLDEVTRRYDVLMDGGFPYLVAALDRRVVGYAYAGAYRPRPAYRFTLENSVYLQPTIHRCALVRNDDIVGAKPAPACGRLPAARDQARSRGAGSIRSPKSRCKCPACVRAADLFRYDRSALPKRGGTPRTRRGPAGNQWHSRATRRRRPCARTDSGYDRVRND